MLMMGAQWYPSRKVVEIAAACFYTSDSFLMPDKHFNQITKLQSSLYKNNQPSKKITD